MQHLFLQGVRSLLQFVSGYVKSEQVKDIVDCMLEVRPYHEIHSDDEMELLADYNVSTHNIHSVPRMRHLR